MVDFFPIIDISADEPDMQEQQGTKEKFWFQDQRYLLKIGRENTGENWSEKIACELAELLGLPHADYQFAVWRGKKGVITESIVPKGSRLVMGNELLSEIHSNYPTDQSYKVRDHTLGRIKALLIHPEILLPLAWFPPTDNSITSAVDVFLGYLFLDAWIANQDRHHENWGVINHQKRIYLAATYDHAASLGQNETDHKRKELLTTRDQGRHISHYVEKARSAIYLNKSASKPLPTLAVCQRLAAKRPLAARHWLQCLAAISTEQCRNIFAKIPPSEISETAIEFALTLLELNKRRLLACNL